jgi:uncharacterized protein YciI
MHVADPRQVPSGIFLYTLHPVRFAMFTEGPTAEEQQLAASHWAYSQELLARGVIVFGGRTLNRDADSFASVAIRAPSLEDARTIANSDPAVAGGLFTARVYPFQPMLMGAWPPEAATISGTASS